MLILFSSHRIATDNSQGNVYKPGSYQPGSTPRENSSYSLESQVPRQANAFIKLKPALETGDSSEELEARSQKLICASRLST